MIIKNPTPDHVDALRRLWKEAFRDEDAYLNLFFETAYSPLRCRCVFDGDTPVAAVYWLDCTCRGKKLAYLYAVATKETHRGRGLCRQLLTDTHRHLYALGYRGTVLVPGRESLFKMYESMGYNAFGPMREFVCAPGGSVAAIHRVTAEEYARLRRQMLPEGGILQEEECLALLDTQAEFYAGPLFLLAAHREEDSLLGLELLGDASAAPGILLALGMAQGRFRIAGGDTPFAMYRPLSAAKAPTYFAFAFD